MLNDRFRVITQRLEQTTTTVVRTTSAGGTQALQQLMLSVPGTLGVKSNAAPVASLPVAITPSQIVGLLKQAPQGATVKAQVNVNGQSFQIIEISGTSATVSGNLGTIAANGLITLDIIQVGTTFPGADLTVELRF